MNNKECLLCGKEFKPRAEGTKYEKKFCSVKCRAVRNARTYYYKHKDEKIFQDRKKARFDRWLKKNKEHFNDLMRIQMRERYFFRKENHLCAICGKPLTTEKTLNHYNCNHKKYWRAKMRKQKIGDKK